MNVSFRDSLAKRDIARKKFSGPLYRRGGGETQHIRIWRQRTLFSAFLIILAFLGYYLFYSPYFQIITVDITPTLYLSQDNFTETVNRYLNSKSKYIFKQNNYFWFNAEKFKNLLNERYLLTELVIEKNWPNHLAITFTEKLSLITVASPENDEWNVINHLGKTARYIKPFHYQESLPFVWKLQTEDLDANVIDLVLKTWQLNDMPNALFQIKRYVLKNSQLLEAYADKGFRIDFNPEHDTDEQIINLRLLIEEFRAKQQLPEEYLLLQYREKVYYK